MGSFKIALVIDFSKQKDFIKEGIYENNQYAQLLRQEYVQPPTGN
jgi:hypothetical protein